MAMVDVETLTDSCWRNCEDFNVDVTKAFTGCAVYHTVVRCREVDKCRRIQQAIEEELKREDDR